VIIGIELDEIAFYDYSWLIASLITAERFEGNKNLKIINDPK